MFTTAVVLALGGLGWFYLAPTQIGGSTGYMITHGISMEPMLHTGDLVLIRPAGSYRVGQVVAYHSTLLHSVVLHRIIRRVGNRYVFKGDNNNFVDPTHPTSALLVGRMWLRIPHGGTVLEWVHRPWVAAALLGGVAMLLLLEGDRRGRRRRRGRPDSSESTRPKRGPSPVRNRYRLTACVVGVAVFAALSVLAFVRPTVGTRSFTIPYTQELSFGYRGPARAGSVYPSGTVRTGDPLYLQLVHRLTVTAGYRLTTTVPSQLHGTIRIRGTLSNSSGWSRGFWLGPPTSFAGDRGLALSRIDLTRLQALTSRVSSQIGAAAGSFVLAVVPRVRVGGTIGGRPVAAAFSPALDLSLGAAQLLSGGSAITTTSSTAGSAQTGLVRTGTGSVPSTRPVTGTLIGVPVKTVRWIALGGLALFTLLTLLLGSRELGGTEDQAARINGRYRHLIVPVDSMPPTPGHPPIEVSSIEALAQLAERSERLILHDRQDDADSYLIDDQGTLYRFRASRATDAEPRERGNEPEPDTTATATATTEPSPGPDTRVQDVPVPVGYASSEPWNDAADSSGAIRLSGKVTPDLPRFGPDPRRPPARRYNHWSRRPEIRIGFTLAPLLTLLAWRQMRVKRDAARQTELDAQAFSRADRRPDSGRRPPSASAGERRRGDRRRRERRGS